jgi:lysozyme
LTNMAFNLGVHGLMGFNQFLSFVQAGNYSAAASDLETTAWWDQVGTRGPKIQALILQGAIA